MIAAVAPEHIVAEFELCCPASRICAPSNCPLPPDNPCDDCGCDYVNPAELRAALKNCTEEEWAYAQATVSRVSRLFDGACGVEDGFFKLAPQQCYGMVFQGNTRAIALPPHIKGSVAEVWAEGVIYGKDEFAVIGERYKFLVLDPCASDHHCVGYNGEQLMNMVRWQGIRTWPACVQVCARWGLDCIPGDVQQAVIEYTAQAFRRRDPAQSAMQGLGFIPAEQLPLSWKLAVKTHRSARRARSAKFA